MYDFMKNDKMILIFGGGRLSTQLKKQSGWDCLSIEDNAIDITKPTTYESYIIKYVNCIAYTNTYDNKKEPHWSVNYLGVIDLVNKCNFYKKNNQQIKLK